MRSIKWKLIAMYLGLVLIVMMNRSSDLRTQRDIYPSEPSQY